MATTTSSGSEVQLDSGDYLKRWLQIPENQSQTLMQALDPRAYVHAYWNVNTRPDGRMFSQARPTKVVSSLLKHSAGSALIQQGETKVLCAMTVQIGQPSPELPDHGDVVVSVSTPDQATHSDTLQSWLQRMLDDLLPPQLTLMTGKACIRLVATVLILQDDGNLMDAALLACMAAWKNTTLPTMEELKESQGKLWWKESPTTSLQEHQSSSSSSSHQSSKNSEYRVSLSMGVLEQEGETKFLVDPSVDESAFSRGSLTMVVSLPGRVLQLEYSGEIALGASELALAAKMAHGRADELAKLL